MYVYNTIETNRMIRIHLIIMKSKQSFIYSIFLEKIVKLELKTCHKKFQ
jgi:hypothetical protein